MNTHKNSERQTFAKKHLNFVLLAFGSLLLWSCTSVPFAAPASIDIVNAGEGEAAGNVGLDKKKVKNDLSLQVQYKKESARQAYKEALQKKENLQYEEAEKLLERAVQLDPSYTDAQIQLDEIRYQLDKLSGNRAITSRMFVQEQKLRIQEAQAQMERLFSKGMALMLDKKYTAAEEQFKRVVEIDSFYPWNLNKPELVKLAQKHIAQAKRLGQDQLVAEKRALDKQVRELSDYRRSHDLVYIKNQIKALKKRSVEAFNIGEYEKTKLLCTQILTLDPNDEDTIHLLERARRLNHIIIEDDIQRKFARNRDLVLRGIDEAAIPYHEIFRFPPREEWEKLGRDTISLENRVKSEEPIENRQIARSLDEIKIKSISFEKRPLNEVLNYLQKISNINIVANKKAQDEIEMGELTVDLPEVTNLTLKNVLQLILEQLGDTGYGYQIKNGAVIIGPSDSLQMKMYTEFYPINDIATSRPNFPAPKLSIRLKSKNEENAVDAFTPEAAGGEATKGSGVGPQRLVELIQSRIFNNEEKNGTVKYQSGQLVIRTTLENHAKINELLESLRKLSGVLVSVESRFLDIQDNILEEIGVDIGGPVESSLEYPIPDVNSLGTSVASGYAFIDKNLRYETRAAVISDYSGFLGTEITPFNISNSGGMALQWNLLENYQLEAIMTTVAKSQKSQALDAPRVLAFDNQIAHTMVIDQIAYIKDVDVNQTGVSPVINPLIGTFRVGSMLEIRPTVTHDRKYVILEVKPTSAQHVDSKYAQLSLAQGYTMVRVELPVILLSQIKTTITIPDGGTVLVGGLKKVIEQQRSIGIPIIQRIPILNILFGRRGETHLRNNLFVLIKSQILSIKEEEKINFP